MSPHLRYLSYLIRHKWFVFVAGLKVGAPLWRLIIHDWSKSLPSEWLAYVESFYGGHNPRPQWVKEDFDRAWLRHQHRNDHHWQHWVLRNDDGSTKPLQMPIACAEEMVADWAGAGRAITGKWEVAAWYAKNHEKILLHPNTAAVVDAMLKVYFP